MSIRGRKPTAPSIQPPSETIRNPDGTTTYIRYYPKALKNGNIVYNKYVQTLKHATPQQKTTQKKIKGKMVKEIKPALLNYSVEEFNKIKPLLENKQILQFVN